MSIVISFKAIKPKKLKIDGIRQEILNALRKEGTEHRKVLNKTVSTWSGDKPKMESLIGLERAGDATVITGPTGNSKAVNKWTWLDKGTKIRWALMSSNWGSKTSPGSFNSGRGSGRPVLVGKRAMQRRNIRPRPGIAPRGWTPKLTKQRKKPFTQNIVKAMRKGGNKLF